MFGDLGEIDRLHDFRVKYFSKNGALIWDEKSSPGRYVRENCKPLERYIPRKKIAKQQVSEWSQIDAFEYLRTSFSNQSPFRIHVPLLLPAGPRRLARHDGLGGQDAHL